MTKGRRTTVEERIDAEAAAWKIELLLDRYIVLSKEIFSEYIVNWFEKHNKNRIIEKHILAENPFAKKEIAKITTADIDLFYNLKLKEKYSTSYILIV